jgi:hypothetical protein
MLGQLGNKHKCDHMHQTNITSGGVSYNYPETNKNNYPSPELAVTHKHSSWARKWPDMASLQHESQPCDIIRISASSFFSNINTDIEEQAYGRETRYEMNKVFDAKKKLN